MSEDKDTSPTPPADEAAKSPEPETQSPATESEKHDDKPAETTADSHDAVAPADALSRTPEELGLDIENEDSELNEPAGAKSAGKKPSGIKKLLKRMNVYLLLFLLIAVIATVIAVVTYLNSQKTPPEVAISSQKLTADTLKDLANTDASIGNASQTLTIQGNVIINGKTLMRSDLNVAGNIQASGSLQGSGLTISGKSNLNDTQINSLQVAKNVSVKGSTTVGGDLSVAGISTFKGAMTASKITVTQLVMTGNAILKVPSHIDFASGPTPGRTIDRSVLGNGGSATINGSDTSGTVNVNTGSSTRSGCFINVRFHKQFEKAPHVMISPIGSATGQMDYYINRTSSGFSICTAKAALTHRSFAFDYFVTG